MLEVAEALQRVLAETRAKSPRTVPLSDALGMVLAEDAVSDVDSPPHDKALMDGYAVLAADAHTGPVELRVLEQVAAGATPAQTVVPGAATRIMTGAPIPDGADAVVMVEQTEPLGVENANSAADVPVRVRINASRVDSGQNIMRRAASMRRGEVVLNSGRLLRPMEIGLLAEVGRAEVRVVPRADVAVLSTGDELVPADSLPGGGQIRNSNGPMLRAMVERAGGRAVDLGIGRDEEAELRRLVALGLQHDVLVLSGGVSAGVLDLVPRVLASEGVEQVFHKVHLKPGKPLWFGIRRRQPHDTLVFGLPGNPVSSLVCFELFVRPAIAALAGERNDAPVQTATLAAAHRQRGDRPTYWPARRSSDVRSVSVTPLNWKGSADLRTLADADCLIYFPPGEREYAVGDEVEIRSL
ncbi:MAG: molybdopterin molybdotransferase MoeA [Pirellulaceae bacterium]